MSARAARAARRAPINDGDGDEEEEYVPPRSHGADESGFGGDDDDEAADDEIAGGEAGDDEEVDGQGGVPLADASVANLAAYLKEKGFDGAAKMWLEQGASVDLIDILSLDDKELAGELKDLCYGISSRKKLLRILAEIEHNGFIPVPAPPPAVEPSFSAKAKLTGDWSGGLQKVVSFVEKRKGGSTPGFLETYSDLDVAEASVPQLKFQKKLLDAEQKAIGQVALRCDNLSIYQTFVEAATKLNEAKGKKVTGPALDALQDEYDKLRAKVESLARPVVESPDDDDDSSSSDDDETPRGRGGRKRGGIGLQDNESFAAASKSKKIERFHRAEPGQTPVLKERISYHGGEKHTGYCADGKKSTKKRRR